MLLLMGGGLDSQLILENVTVPEGAVIDRPGQVHRLPNKSLWHPNNVTVSATGEVILGSPCVETIRGRERIIAYLRNTGHSDLIYDQVLENIDFVQNLTLPEKK